MIESRKKAWTKWRRLVAQQGRSEQSVAAFCRERGLCAPHFFVWKKRLGQVQAAQFVEVSVARAEAKESVRSRPGLEIRLKNGRSILVEPGFDATHLRALLAVLELGE